MLTAVILAAGEASRMGELKQLLEWENKNTILGKTVDNLLAAEIVDEELQIVVGAQKLRVVNYLQKKYRSELNSGIIRIIENDNYQKGMMSSVKKSLNSLLESNQHLLFTLADKPFIGPGIYREFYQKYLELKADIFVPEYHGQKGHPVIIKNSLKNIALKLEGEGGLRNLFAVMPDRIHYHLSNYQEITIDIDLKQDYWKYRNNDHKFTD
ncbi:nucleotidyltransferase family protein [Halanaerobium sp. ST460_2HS_T2]|uniref:nucleotidyltransferase family protein n=1 Tax=Halanaerobium sp. ST460_2HS_T2 TaxID=2183914 RepID=UPI000DF44010|nr:nucleotidyltransferase family protein [Halanaerobium sp. ST460_2HS_T2]RCW62351.1 molybdenum cofactor cytidylyltransferase [Halanaerobium sp. ST460_2HS_T2]